MECYTESEMAEEYRALAVQMYRICGGALRDGNSAVKDECMSRCVDAHIQEEV